MDDTFTKLNNSINAMRLKVINVKGENVKGLSEPVVTNNNTLTKKQIKTQEK